MNKEELNAKRKQLSHAVKIILNDWWKGRAHVEIIVDKLMWFSIHYNKKFDARNELQSLGIEYDAHPRHCFVDQYDQDFWLDENIFTKIVERVKAEKSN